jgi:dephospho-CoA kinase
VYLIGLTGGIAAGKSTVAEEFSRLGALVLDADQVSRDVMRPGSIVMKHIAKEFGDDVISSDGTLNRERLGELVFADVNQLNKLNAIVHPAVKAHTRDLLSDIEKTTPDAVVVYDVPLLIEANVDHPWDLIIVAMAPEQERVKRLTELRGHTREEAIRRIEKQASDEERRSVADVIIDTSRSLEDTKEQTRAVWQRIQLNLGAKA